MVSDPVADLLTRLRNANLARHERVLLPCSKLKVEIARILQQEGYIEDFAVVHEGKFDELRITLKYADDRRRVYAKSDRLPKVLGGLGTAILSTPSGLITSREAATRGIGGEVLCFVW